MAPTPAGSFLLFSFAVLALAAGGEDAMAADDDRLASRVKGLCRKYIEGFGSKNTNLVYHRRLNGARGVRVLSSPQEIAKGTVRGKPMPYGYGSGIQDVPLENGQFLFALCDAHEATADRYLAETAKHIFQGMQLVATVSPEPGFVPRGPHPDRKSYYRNSSRDQHAAFVEGMWRFSRSPLATAEDKAFIAKALDRTARRMERNAWKIMVEDGSEMAHVGWGWRQHTSIGAITLLSFLAQVRDATGDDHWARLYEQFSREKDSLRWRKLLHPDAVGQWRPLTLYSNQFDQALAALERTENDVERRRQLRAFSRRIALRTLESNVFNTAHWRRLDWAGGLSDAETEKRLQPFGLSLKRKATVFDLYRAFDPKQWQDRRRTIRAVSGKLCFGIPTVAFHAAIFSQDPELIRRVAPGVRDMVGKMLAHGHLYTGGEDFNRAVVLGLLLVATEARPSAASPR